MERQIIFHVLGIQETKDENMIRDAYRTLLKNTNPEDDPEGFKRLREAYEGALQFSRQPQEQGEEAKEKTDIDLWVERADKVYCNILQRNSAAQWQEILSDPVCDDLDTSLEAREAFLVYLMDHIYLPHEIWELVDRQFQIVEDRESILQKFPKDFLDYAVYYIQHDSFIDYGLFRITNEEQMDADAYIRNYLDIKRQIDRGDKEGLLEKLDQLEAFGVYHPYADAERLRLWSLDGESWREDKALEDEKNWDSLPVFVQQAQDLTDRLLREYENDSYILLYCGEARWAAGRKEEAYQIWKTILKDNPSHYTAKYGAARYLIMKEEYEEAKELMMDLLNADGRDEAVLEDMRKTNEALIARYKESIAKPDIEESVRCKDTVELGWCLFQNEYMDEAIELITDFVPDEEQTYSYENLTGRLLYRAEKYEEALPHLERWLELIRATKDDGSDENKKRISREYRACHILSGCCFELKRQEEALNYVDMAIEAAEEFSDKQACMQYKAYLFFEDKRYKDSIDVCDAILAQDEGYFPAVIQRQEAAYEMKNGQQVVDDYYRAIRIYAGYYKPYLLAAEAFFYSNQFSDALGVLDRARENQVEFSANMRLYEVKVLRNLAEKREDREKAFAIAEELLKALENPDGEMDIEDKSEVEYEIALLYWDDNDMDKALEHLQKAIDQNPNRMQYRMIRGHIYLDKKEYKMALAEYKEAESVYGSTPALHYNCGLCQEELGMKALAMEEFEKSLQCQEGYRDANEKLADYYKEKYSAAYDPADFEKAMGYIDNQLKVRENCYYLVEKGRLFMSAYRLEEAILEFEKALGYEPDDWASHNNMGCCYKYLGQFEKAIECLEKAVQCMGEGKSVLPYSNMADCYEALGDYEKAIWCYKKDLEMFPDRKAFRKEIGLLYQYMGDYDNALNYFQLEPDLDDYYENVAMVLYLQGKKREAIKTYVKGINKASKDNKTSRMCDLAYFYKDILGDFRKAEGYYKRALAAALTEDDRRETEWKLAYLYFRMGKKQDARLHAAKSLEHFKNSDSGTEENYLKYYSFGPARLMRFGWLYICLGETEKGLKMLKDMTRWKRCRQCRYKACYEGYQHLGMYYEAAGDREKACEYYKKALEFNNHEITITIALKRVQKI